MNAKEMLAISRRNQMNKTTLQTLMLMIQDSAIDGKEEIEVSVSESDQNPIINKPIIAELKKKGFSVKKTGCGIRYDVYLISWSNA